MSRSQPYRSKMPIQILKTMDVASRITLFMVGQSGPLSFTFKDRLGNKYKTTIGAQLKCSCSPTKNDHCIHTLYVMLKIFRVSPQNPVIWQAAYVDSELTDLLAGKHTIQANRRMIRPIFQDLQDTFSSQLPSEFFARKREKAYSYPESKAQRMKLNQDSVCPICQQSMSEDQSLSYCRVKCGNNFHLQCLKVWAEHKSTTETAITCPMCRTPFGDNFIKDLQHQQKVYKKQQANKIKIKFKCSGCGIDQIPKNVHKCILCTSYELCESCYLNNKHIKHQFIRQCEDNPQRWCGGQERREQQLKMKKFIDNKRKQKNINEQLLQKLRKVQEDPNKLLDFVASTYPYVSKYISDNVDPYKKMDLNPEDMKCMKCLSKKMIFLRRLTCGHFIDHQCLKQDLRKGKFYCDSCGCKLVKGYENLKTKQKELEDQKQKLVQVSDEFNPQRMEKNRKQQQEYNFVLPEEATLADILGGRIQSNVASNPPPQPDQSRLRQRLASNIVRGSQALNQFRNIHVEPRQIKPTHIRNQSQTVHNQLGNSNEQSNRNVNNLRIRNMLPRSTQIIQPQSQHRSVSHNARKQTQSRKQGNKRSREDMANILEAMIGRKLF